MTEECNNWVMVTTDPMTGQVQEKESKWYFFFSGLRIPRIAAGEPAWHRLLSRSIQFVWFVHGSVYPTAEPGLTLCYFL